MKAIKSFVYVLFLILFSKQFYKIILRKKIIEFKEKNDVLSNEAVIFYPHAIGDTFNLSLFINEFKIKYNYDCVILCTKSYIKGIESLIENLGVNGIISFDSGMYFPLRLAGFVHDHKNNIFVINHVYFHEKTWKKNSFFEYFPILLSLNITKEEIDLNLKSNFIKLNNEIIYGKIEKAVLFPYPGTLGLIDEQYWEEVVVTLKLNNIQVYTNIINESQKVIKGSDILKLKLDEIVGFVDSSTIIVARRNGLNDVFAFNNCKQLIIYVKTKKNEFKRYSLLDLYKRLDRINQISEICIDKFYNKEDSKKIELLLSDMMNK